MRTSLINLGKHLARTHVSPTITNSFISTSFKNLTFQPKSLLLLTTPQNCVSIQDQITQLQQLTSLTVISASLDSNFQNCVSELWLEDEVDIIDFEEYQENEKFQSKNWSIVNSELNLNFDNHKASISVSNSTLFHSGEPFNLRIHDSRYTDKNLTLLLLRVPLKLAVTNTKNNFVSLTPPDGGLLQVTEYAGNLILKINGNPASSYLLHQIEEAGYKHVPVSVFAKITAHDGGNSDYNNTFEVIAGGGEWGPRSDALALKDINLPEIAGAKYIEFLIIDPTTASKVHVPSSGIYFEKVQLEETSDSKPQVQVLEPLFGFGSIDGFQFDDINQKSSGELLQLDIQT